MVIENGNTTKSFHFQEQPWKCSVKKSVLKNLANFTGEQLCWSLFLIKFHVFRPTTFLKRSFPVKFVKFVKTPVRWGKYCNYLSLRVINDFIFPF